MMHQLREGQDEWETQRKSERERDGRVLPFWVTSSWREREMERAVVRWRVLPLSHTNEGTIHVLIRLEQRKTSMTRLKVKRKRTHIRTHREREGNMSIKSAHCNVISVNWRVIQQWMEDKFLSVFLVSQRRARGFRGTRLSLSQSNSWLIASYSCILLYTLNDFFSLNFVIVFIN